jgi:hypothetical protein
VMFFFCFDESLEYHDNLVWDMNHCFSLLILFDYV